jgi:hypothetical protein
VQQVSIDNGFVIKKRRYEDFQQVTVYGEWIADYITRRKHPVKLQFCGSRQSVCNN